MALPLYFVALGHSLSFLGSQFSKLNSGCVCRHPPHYKEILEMNVDIDLTFFPRA